MAVTLNDNALTTLSVVKDELGITGSGDDDYLRRQINHMSDLFEEATWRPWHRKSSYDETVKSIGDTRLRLERRPVRSISSISVKGDTVDSADYTIEDADKGWVRLDDDFWENTAVGRRRVEPYTKYFELRADVTYDGGYVTQKQVDDGTFSPKDLPGGIEMAVIDSVATKFRLRGRPSGIDSESIGSASVSYATPSQSGDVLGQTVSESFESAVRRHKSRSVI